MSADRRRTFMRRLGQAAKVTTVVALGAWFLLLRPQALGGPAAYILVNGVSMEPSLHAGDLAVVVSQPSYSVGDVIAYRVPGSDPAAGHIVIHRLIGGSADGGYIVRGDNTDGPDVWRPLPSDVVGRMSFVVGGVGPVIGFIRSPLLLASLAALTTAVFAMRVLGPPAAGREPADAPLAFAAAVPDAEPK